MHRKSDRQRSKEHELAQWIVSVWWGQGDVYVRLQVDTPEWVRHLAVEHFGKSTYFPRSERLQAQAA